MALEESHTDSKPANNRRPYQDFGINQLGWVLDDLDVVVDRLENRGYRRGIPGETHKFRRRVNYYDSAGFEWEIIQYQTDIHPERFYYD